MKYVYVVMMGVKAGPFCCGVFAALKDAEACKLMHEMHGSTTVRISHEPIIVPQSND